MNKKEHFLARSTKQIPAPVGRVPLVELTGERRLLVENHDGVTEYGVSKICIGVKYGQIQICGKCLRLEYLAKDRLLITGTIDSITLCRRC